MRKIFNRDTVNFMAGFCVGIGVMGALLNICR